VQGFGSTSAVVVAEVSSVTVNVVRCVASHITPALPFALAGREVEHQFECVIGCSAASSPFGPGVVEHWLSSWLRPTHLFYNSTHALTHSPTRGSASTWVDLSPACHGGVILSGSETGARLWRWGPLRPCDGWMLGLQNGTGVPVKVETPSLVKSIDTHGLFRRRTRFIKLTKRVDSVDRHG
jgi:hypothetical protein